MSYLEDRVSQLETAVIALHAISPGGHKWYRNYHTQTRPRYGLKRCVCGARETVPVAEFNALPLRRELAEDW